MPDTSIRYLAMLRHVPAPPRRTSVGELYRKLKAEGFHVSERTLQRDLEKLSGHFPLLRDDNKPAGWSWEGVRLTFPGMDATSALTYELIARYLKPLLPHAMRERLEDDFTLAQRVLNEFDAPVGKWSRRIAVIPSGHQLLPPEIRAGVVQVVYEALLNGKRFTANYRSLGADKAKCYEFNPQGLVYRQGVLYLVASLWEYDEGLQYALHRMSNAEPLDKPAAALEGFDLARYIHEDKEFEFPVGPDMTLELRVAPWLAQHLQERRLSKDQAIVQARDDETFRVTAKVRDTQELLWWLRSLGPAAEVLKPVSLRRRLAKDAAAVAATHR